LFVGAKLTKAPPAKSLVATGRVMNLG